jgi:hypothetical protein
MNDPRHLAGEDDALLRQVRQVLDPMPDIDRRAIAQIMAKVAERERTPRSRLALWWERARTWWQLDVPPVARASSLAAAALMIGFVARGALPFASSSPASPAAAPALVAQTAAAPAAAPLVAVDGTDPSAMRVPVQFVLDAREVPHATQVSVVGDFNDWDARALPMTLEGGVWSSTVPVLPGRHVYAFVVNGESWMADPRAAKAPDADFGRPGSVIIVQTP